MIGLLLVILAVFLSLLVAVVLAREAGFGKKSARSKRARLFTENRDPAKFGRAEENPLLAKSDNAWEAEAVMNPAAINDGERTHLLYRAIGTDGVSRLGYASSADGVHFDERLPYPVYSHTGAMPKTGARYDPGTYGSGGSWSGVEDPRAVLIDNRVYITYNAFNGWDSMRVALTSILLPDLKKKNWNFTDPHYLSPARERHKNWVLFPKKINGKFALFHNLYSGDAARVRVEYIDDLLTHDPEQRRFESHDPHQLPDINQSWHYRTRSIGPPPVATPFGWLTFYHAMDPRHPDRYKMGALLHDMKDPTRVLARAPLPVLEPEASYEAHQGVKPGIIYACGAVVKGDDLVLYYGAADTAICAAATSLRAFVHKLLIGEPSVFTPVGLSFAA